MSDDSSKVVGIDGRPAIILSQLPPNPQIIEMLEGLLSSAKSGQISSFCYATIGSDGTTGHGCSGVVHAALLGTLMLVVHRLTVMIDQ